MLKLGFSNFVCGNVHEPPFVDIVDVKKIILVAFNVSECPLKGAAEKQLV